MIGHEEGVELALLQIDDAHARRRRELVEQKPRVVRRERVHPLVRTDQETRILGQLDVLDRLEGFRIEHLDVIGALAARNAGINGAHVREE